MELLETSCHLLFLDVNECESIPCQGGGRCVNTKGSFRCECINNFVLGPDGRTCLGTAEHLNLKYLKMSSLIL